MASDDRDPLAATQPAPVAATVRASLVASDDRDPLAATQPAPVAATVRASLGELAAIGRIEKALFGGPDQLVRVGRYEIGALLGRGAFGKVYRARDPELARDVALKVTEATLGEADRDQLLGEARVMATLAHPNIAAVFDAGVIDEGGRVRVFVALELVTGGDLRAWLPGRSRAAIVDALVQAGRGLAAAHAAGIVHRDFKPDNVLIGADGRVRVADFGLARVTSAEAGGVHASGIAGTPAYMAPEQWADGVASAASDQYAFAVTAWEALAGTRPFGGASIEALIAAQTAPLPAPPRALGPQRAAIVRALARDPAARFPEMDAMLASFGPRRARWIVPAALVATAALGLGAGALALGHPAAPAGDPCPRPTVELDGAWDSPRRAAIASAFHAAGPRGEVVLARITPALEQAANSWLDARVTTCRATEVAHTQPEPVLVRRVACLRAWRRAFAAMTDGFAHVTSAAAVDDAPTQVSLLPALAQCTDDVVAARPAPPPGVDVLEEHLATARMQQATGDVTAAIATLGEVTADPLALTYGPIAITADLQLGELLEGQGRLDDANAVLHRAFDAATATSDARGAATAAADLAMLGAFDPRRVADAQPWVGTGRALLPKLDDARELDARLANAEGQLDLASGVSASAEAAFTRAIAVYRKLDPDHPALGPLLVSRGGAEVDLGRLDDADRDLEDGIARIARDLGPDHPQLGPAHGELALALGARGRYVDATHAADDAIARVHAVYGDASPQLAYLYLDRAQLAVARGQLAAAGADLAAADRIATATLGRAHPLTAQIGLAASEVLARTGHTKDAVARAAAARDALANNDAPSAALGDAAVAGALLADHQGAAALALAKAAAARIDAVPNAPGALRGIVDAQLGEIALAQHDDALAASALRSALAAFAAGAPDPRRVALARFALARALRTIDPAAARASDLAARASYPPDAAGDGVNVVKHDESQTP